MPSPDPRPPGAEPLAGAPDAGALPVAPSLAPALARVDVRAPADYEPVDRRTVGLAGAAVALAIVAGLAAQLLVRLIGLVTNLAFYGRVSTAFVSPAGGHRAPLALVLTPVLGALVVGV